MPCKTIYLSPSLQDSNRYVIGNTNERVQMEALALEIKRIMDTQYACDVYLPSPAASTIEGRVNEAKSLGADIYVSIHSNASGTGRATGPIAFYHPSSTTSREMARQMVEEINRVTPIPSNRITPVINGMEVYDSQGYADIREPWQQGIIPVLVETNFHDNPQAAQFIIDNKPLLASAMVKALDDTFELTKETSTNPSDTRYYRVQVGAFTKRDNAEALVKKLQDAGFSAIITYS